MQAAAAEMQGRVREIKGHRGSRGYIYGGETESKAEGVKCNNRETAGTWEKPEFFRGQTEGSSGRFGFTGERYN